MMAALCVVQLLAFVAGLVAAVYALAWYTR